MEFIGLEKLSLVDYDDKVSTTLFSGGCNFACPFCHNSLLVNDFKNCETYPFDEILAYLRKRKGVIDAVVISGGEPTLMPDLIEKIKQIKELGFLVKLDTNGTNPAIIKFLVDNKLIDYVAMDIKNSEEKYPLTVGKINIDIEKIKESINYLKQNHVDFEFRTTLIKEFHDFNDMKEILKLIKGAKKYRLQKFIDRDTCIKKGLHPISLDEANKYLDVFKNDILDVKLRGY